MLALLQFFCRLLNSTTLFILFARMRWNNLARVEDIVIVQKSTKSVASSFLGKQMVLTSMRWLNTMNRIFTRITLLSWRDAVRSQNYE